VTIVCGEDGCLFHDGEPIGGSEPEAPLRLNLAELVILTSGFALRADDEWRRALLLDLAEYHRCDVAAVP
jgi:hypothetical protein